MSDKLPDTNQNEEVDLGALFNAIGKFFDKLFGFITGVLKSIFSAIIYLIKIIIENFKLIAIVFLVALILGLGLERFRKQTYYSEMLVKPYFESKYQLVSNIDYFNSLLENENREELSSIFEINQEDALAIRKFEINIGPETENKLLQEYDNYIKSIDSIRAQDVSYEDFVENRDLFSSDIFSIRVESYKREIFKKLSQGIKKTFYNEYSQKLMRVRDSTLSIKKAVYKQNLRKIDSLQIMYLKILEKESENGAVSMGVEGMFPLTQERTPTKEYDLFLNEIRLRDSIRVLDQLKIEENVYFDVLSEFSEIGIKSSDLTKKYSLIFPVIAMLFLFLAFITIKVIKFAREYEE